jgi:predicted metalloendopeptidase
VEKARAIKNKIGYPGKWRDTSSVTIAADDYFGNTIALNIYDLEYNLDKVGNPPDPDEWHMSPQTVNAYYNPTQNEIVFPAGILQDPFFSAENPRAMNFGAMGTIMGHEISHGFDDSGRKFSATGTLEEWWEPEVSERFDERAECLIEQYAGYEPLPGKPLNGKLTLGENIADNGGMKQSFRAYMQWVEENGAEPELAGFTNEQLFFVGAAQSWCSLITPELQEQFLVTDPHSPPKFRLNGSVINFLAFAEAFECQVGSPMNPEQRCEVW